MPAVPSLLAIFGRSIKFAATTRPFGHSFSCTARRPACAATSAAEHALSYEAHVPCIPSTYDSRPDAMARLLPVAAYTLLAAGDTARISSNSVAPMPRNTPVPLPFSAE
eukprot:6534977-Prymnesium_polylepis.1